MANGEMPQALLEAKTRNENAQANYYEEKAKSRSISMGTILAGAGQLTALAGVLAAFYATFSSNTQQQASREDAAFYNAMNRVGDQDSVIVRLGAVPLLAEHAKEEKYYLAVELQLLHAFLVEDDPTVLGALQDALLKLKSRNPAVVRQKLETVREKVQVQILGPLAALSLDAEGKAPLPDKITPEQWSRILALIPQTGFDSATFESLITDWRKEIFEARQKSAKVLREAMTSEQQQAYDLRMSEAFRAAAIRLRLLDVLLDEEQ